MPARIFSRAYGLLAVVAVAQACDSRFEFDMSPKAGAAGALAQAGAVSAAGMSSSGGSDRGGVGASSGSGGSSSGASGSSSGGGGSNAAGDTSAGAGGTPMSGGACGAVAACPAPLHCAHDVCAQCAEDVDCEPYNLARCDQTRHRCVACIDTVDCQAGLECDPFANHCLQPCTQDANCPATTDGCDGLRRLCSVCDEDEGCQQSPLGHHCASDRSGCVQCRNDVDCPGQLCDQLTGRCVECRDGADCSSGLCDPMTGSCINP